MFKEIAKSILPTPWGKFTIIVFEEKESTRSHLALIYGNVKKKKSVLSRVHSECLTGDALFSLRCDCGFQLRKSLKMIAEEKNGVLIYHRQEGRNIGLLNKIKAYALQDVGFDTVEANHKLGFSADERDFSICADIFKTLGVFSIRLLTNNPLKVKMLSATGLDIIKRVPLIIGKNKKNINYLNTKKKKMGHILDI